MAKQSGFYKITGTIENLCFYEMEGKFYVRTKSCLTAKRVKNDQAFKNTMHHAQILANASKISSVFYKKIPAELKAKGLFRKITGQVMELLKAGNSEASVMQFLDVFYLAKPIKKEAVIETKVIQSVFTAILFQNVFAERLPACGYASFTYSNSPP